MPATRVDWYDWRGGREAMLRSGPADGPQVVVAMPLLDEANRTRTIVVQILRLLGDRGIGGCLPDLPGMGESVTDLADVTFDDWLDAFEVAAGGAALTVAIRGGALIDVAARPQARYLLGPLSGHDQVRAWRRLEALAIEDIDVPTVAGNAVPPALFDALDQANWRDAAPSRVVRLGQERGEADHRVDAIAPWRRAEPTDDRMLAAALADDLARWVATCAGT